MSQGDAHGPMVMLDTFTNGPEDQPWDLWQQKWEAYRTFEQELGDRMVHLIWTPANEITKKLG